MHDIATTSDESDVKWGIDRAPNDEGYWTAVGAKLFPIVGETFLFDFPQTAPIVSKDQNIGKHGYIGNWILRKYRKISVDILTKISVMEKLTKIL